MTEIWDWRQSFARYSDTIEDQVAHPAVPETPQGVGAGHQPPAAPHKASKESGWRPDSEPDAHLSRQSAGPSPPVALRGGRPFSIAAFVCGAVAPLCFPLILGPFILGPLGVVFGFVGCSKGDRIGRWAGLMSLATTVLGIALSLWVARHVGLHFED